MTERNATETLRLYEADASLMSFDATVLSCEKGGEGYAIILDRTAFFPTGGGQPCDRGTLGNVAVTEVIIVDGQVLHRVGSPLAVGTVVKGCLDAERRRRHMTVHTAEHILSSVLFRRYGLHNVGFHVGHEDTTCDFDGTLDREALSEVEAEVNRILRENHPVRALFPTPEELARLDYRSKLELLTNVRIVAIGEEGRIDRCACCAPHVTRTGEVGSMLITEAYRYKGGMRLHLLAGEDAVRRTRQSENGLTALSVLLSAKPNVEAVTEAVTRLWEEHKALKAALAAADDALNAALCRSLPSGERVCLCDTRDDVTALRRLAILATERTGEAVLVLGGGGDSCRFVLAGQGAKELYAALCSRLPCRGGGNERMICGSISSDRAAICEGVAPLFTPVE